MRIIDTHLHLIYQDRFSYPWLEDVPAINRNYHVDTYLQQATQLGIEQALHVEVDVAEKDIEAEARFVTTVDPRIAATIASARPERSDFPKFLDRLVLISGVKGLRRVLHTSSDCLSRTDLFVKNIRLLADYSLPFDLCILPRQLPIGCELVDHCPDVQFILDHCGVPDIAGRDFDTWRADITELALRPNIVAKISGVIAYAGDNWIVDDLRPHVNHVIEQFGWDRVMWGSDFPVCTLTANLASWVEATHALIAGASVSEQRRLFHTNAERIYSL